MASIARLKELDEKRQKLAAQIRELGKKEGEWTAEDETAWEAANKAYDENYAAWEKEQSDLKAEKEREEARESRLAAIDAHGGDFLQALRRDNGTLAEGPAHAQFFGQDRPEDKRALAIQGWFLANSSAPAHTLTDKHRQAAAACGVNLASPQLVLNLADTRNFQALRQAHQVRNSMQVGNPVTGGFLVGETLLTSLERAMLDYSGVLQVASIMRTNTGEPLKWPTVDDTDNEGTLVGENKDAGTASDPSFGQAIWHAHDFTSGVLKISRSLLQDSPINLEQEIGAMMGERLGRKQNREFTTGGGGGVAPRGIVTAAALGKTTASATAIVYDELIDLEHSVDPSRRNLPGVGYMFNDAILQYLRKLKDGNGNYLWSNGTQAGQPDRINNRPYAINQHMASSIASGNKTVLFGHLPSYKVRQVGMIVIQRLVERFAEFNQDAYIAYMRADGNLLDAGDNPVKYLTH